MSSVAIVDDDRDIREMIRVILETRGYRVIEARDGQDALERLVDDPPDLILLDLMMPRMDGVEFCQRQQQDPRLRQVPVVILSGKGVKTPMEGPRERLRKPIDLTQLLDVVRRNVQSS